MDWIHRLPMRVKIASLGGLILLLMLGATAVMSFSVRQYLLSDGEKDKVLAVTEQTDSLLQALTDMETGVRGFVISGNAEFLDPYLDGAAHYPLVMSRLETLFDGSPAQQETLSKVQVLVKQWREDVLEPELVLVRQGKAAEAMALVASGAGKRSMDQIRQLLHSARKMETERAHAVAHGARHAADLAWYGTLGVAAAAVLLGLYLSWAIARSLTRSMEDLAAAFSDMSTGEYGRQVAVPSDHEIGLLARSFNRMSLDLASHMKQNAAQAEELSAQQEEMEAQNDQLLSQQAALEQERDRLEELNRFSRGSMEHADLKDFSRFLLDELMTAAGAQVGAVAVLLSHNRMNIMASSGLTAEAAAADRVGGLIAEAACSRRPLQVSHPLTALLRPVYHTELPVQHELYLPIAYGDETQAVAILGWTDAATLSAHDMQWLSVLGAQAAAALSNRMAYAKLSQTYSDLKDSSAHIEELTAQIEDERDRAMAQRDNLRAILESTSEGICMVDLTGQVLLVNDRFWQLAGLDADSAHTLKHLRDHLIKQMRDPVEMSRRLRIDSDPDYTGTRLLELTQSRFLQVFTTPVRSDMGYLLGRLFVLRDVTRETEVDRMKTEFISTVSHELRTPLTSIRGYVELILDGDVGEITDEQREFLELVTKSTVRLSNLINDLLDVEKIENGRITMQREPVDLTDVLDQVVRTFEITAAERNLGLHLEIEGPLPAVPGDCDRLTQVFTNLVSNGIKYTKAGEVRVTARVQGSDVVVAVSDTGIGISDDHLSHLFSKFYRVDNQYTREVGGTGLGLSISKAIVERHGGRVEVTSAPGQGSTFTVTLPATAASDSSLQTPAERPAGQLVLIIEDEPDVARLVAQHVMRHGVRTVIASTGAEGLELARALKPDLITLDVMMPRMDGWEVIARLKHDPATASIPVVFLSILEETERGFRLGADAYLTKPIDARRLSAVLTRFLRPGQTTALLALTDPAPEDLLACLADLGCRTVVAETGRDLALQAALSRADLLLLDRCWSTDCTPDELVRDLRLTPGLEHLPVILVSAGSEAALDVLPDFIGATHDTVLGPELIAQEIKRRLSEA